MLPAEKKHPTRRQLQALETKKKLLESAVSLFAVHGFDAVTIEDITYNAGTSKGAFYSHFRSKHDVVLERFREQDEANYANYDRAMREKTSMDQLVHYMCSYTDYVMDYIGMDLTRIAFINQVTHNRSEFYYDETRPGFFLLENIIKQGQKKGEFRKDLSSTFLMQMVVRLLSSWIYEWCVHDGNFNVTEQFRKHLLLMHPVLKPQ